MNKNSTLPSSVNTFKVVLKTNSKSGDAGSVSKNIRKFVIHPDYNPKTQVSNHIVYVAWRDLHV